MAPGCERMAMDVVKPFGWEGTLRRDKWRDLLQEAVDKRGHREPCLPPKVVDAENASHKDLDDHIEAAALALDIHSDIPANVDVIRSAAAAYLSTSSSTKDTDKASVCWAAVLLYSELGNEEDLLLAGLCCLGAAQLFDQGASRSQKLVQVATYLSDALAVHLSNHPFFSPLRSTAVYTPFLTLLLWSWDIAFTLHASDGRDQDVVVLHQCEADLTAATDSEGMLDVVQSFAASVSSDECGALIEQAHVLMKTVTDVDGDSVENGHVKTSTASDTMYSAAENEDDALLERGEVVHLDLGQVLVRNELPDGCFIDIPSRLLLTNYRLILQRKRCSCDSSTDGDQEQDSVRGEDERSCAVCKIDIRYADSPYKAIGCYTRVGGEVVEVPVYSIRKIEEVAANEVLLCRNNMHRLRLSFPPLSMPGFRNLCKPLCNADVTKTFAFQVQPYPEQRLSVGLREKWQRFSAAQDFARLGMNDSKRFRVLDQTDTYAFCSTYPRVLHVAANMTDAQLKDAAGFRSRQRIPVAVWKHKRNGAILARCAQPMVGLRNSRSKQDERLVCELLTGRTMKELKELDIDGADEGKEDDAEGATNGTNGATVPVPVPVSNGNGVAEANWVSGMISTFATFTPFDSRQKDASASSMMSREEEDRQLAKFGFYIMDARSKIASYGNRALGRGTENPVNYKGAHLLFMAIDNIQRVQASFERLVEVVQPSFSEDSLARAVADSGWLLQVKSILSASVKVVHVVERYGRSVLTHCSDGWDRTAQIVALSQLLLDPFYRSRFGFSVLVEKEWCSFGHKFKDRYDHGNQGSAEFAPVFLLWIDCVWQVMRQFPDALEFNENFLITLMDHVDSGRFGTFLMNCEKERKKANVEELTEPIWPMLNSEEQFKNQSYKQVNSVLYPGYLAKNIRLWEAFYFRYDPTMTRD